MYSHLWLSVLLHAGYPARTQQSQGRLRIRRLVFAHWLGQIQLAYAIVNRTYEKQQFFQFSRGNGTDQIKSPVRPVLKMVLYQLVYTSV